MITDVHPLPNCAPFCDMLLKQHVGHQFHDVEQAEKAVNVGVNVLVGFVSYIYCCYSFLFNYDPWNLTC